MEWFWVWAAFVVLLFLFPLVYGWAYRGWGAPPWPARRRRVPPPTADRLAEEREAEEDEAWGVLAVVVWLTAIVALFWLLIALLA